MKLYPHGFTLGTIPSKNNHKRAIRGDVGGWSNSSTRSNTRFLRSVDEKNLNFSESGENLSGYGLTLTLKKCPETHEDWHKMRRAFLMRVQRMGLERCHWLTEWQKRGVPHLHMAIWLPEPKSAIQAVKQRKAIVAHWLAIAGPYGALGIAQKVTKITDSVGWFKYLSKHASRGVSNYQRSPENIPKKWAKTGRMWGNTGNWDCREPIDLKLSDSGYYCFRRIVRGWRVADAKAEHKKIAVSKFGTVVKNEKTRASLRRIKTCKNMLKCHDEILSNVRGVSEWLEMDEQLKIVDLVARMGHLVTHGEEE
jgi:hypothetical protein